MWRRSAGCSTAPRPGGTRSSPPPGAAASSFTAWTRPAPTEPPEPRAHRAGSGASHVSTPRPVQSRSNGTAPSTGRRRVRESSFPARCRRFPTHRSPRRYGQGALDTGQDARDRRLIRDVQPVTRARQAHNRFAARRKRVAQGRADAATGPDDKRFLCFHRGELSRPSRRSTAPCDVLTKLGFSLEQNRVYSAPMTRDFHITTVAPALAARALSTRALLLLSCL